MQLFSNASSKGFRGQPLVWYCFGLLTGVFLLSLSRGPSLASSAANAVQGLGVFGAESDTSVCALSMSQSHGFMCESDASWLVRRSAYERQQPRQMMTHRDQNGKPGKEWWQENYEPNFSCSFEERLGRRGDGGKWVCDPTRIAQLSETKKCVVYSIGSNNDFSFEEDVKSRLPNCEIHTFDHTVTSPKVPTGVTFHMWGLAAEDSGSMRSLSSIAKELGHNIEDKTIEVLKVDIEGNEWDVFIPQLKRKELSGVRQFLVELHPRYPNETREFFELMNDQGWVITHKEPNILQQGKLVEYNFLNLGWEAV